MSTWPKVWKITVRTFARGEHRYLGKHMEKPWLVGDCIKRVVDQNPDYDTLTVVLVNPKRFAGR